LVQNRIENLYKSGAKRMWTISGALFDHFFIELCKTFFLARNKIVNGDKNWLSQDNVFGVADFQVVKIGR
jgi:hypothetical protein